MTTAKAAARRFRHCDPVYNSITDSDCGYFSPYLVLFLIVTLLGVEPYYQATSTGAPRLGADRLI